MWSAECQVGACLDGEGWLDWRDGRRRIRDRCRHMAEEFHRLARHPSSARRLHDADQLHLSAREQGRADPDRTMVIGQTREMRRARVACSSDAWRVAHACHSAASEPTWALTSKTGNTLRRHSFSSCFPPLPCRGRHPTTNSIPSFTARGSNTVRLQGTTSAHCQVSTRRVSQ